MLGKKTQLALLALALAGSLLFVSHASAAAQWVTNPASCNHTDAFVYPGQNCISPVNICGDSSGIAQCYNTSGITAPSGTVSSDVQYSGSFPGGGYILNCYADKDLAAPYCDNGGALWCNRSDTCHNTNHKVTDCTGGSFGVATCGAACISGYQDCDATPSVCEVQTGATDCAVGSNNNIGGGCACQCDSGYLDCDGLGPGVGNGCEIHNGGACTVGGLPGTYVGCTCTLPKQNFVANTENIYATSGPFLWGRNYGLGDLIKFGNSTTPDIFVVSNDGAVTMAASTSAPLVTTDKLYNLGGDLYWNGVELGGATTTFSNITWVDATSTGNTVLQNLTVNANSSFSTITAGVWQGGIINPQFGGTGQNSSAWNGFVKVVGGTWGTSTISVSDLNGSSTLAYLNVSTNTFTGDIIMHNLTVTGTANFATLTAQFVSSTNAVFGDATSTNSFFTNLLTAVTGWFSDLFWVNATSTGNTHLTNLTATGTTDLATTTATRLSLSDALVLATNTPASTINALYNNGGALMWNGQQLAVVTSTFGDITWVNATGTGTTNLTNLILSGNTTSTGNIYTGGYVVASSGLRTNLYCDRNGSNCFDPSVSGWPAVNSSTMATQLFLSVATTNGNFASGGFVGYQAATDMCQTEFAGSHFCFTGEILHIIAVQGTAGFTTRTAWIAEGPPGYTANSNDCNGYTTSDRTVLGAFWLFNPTGGGAGWLTNCEVVKSVSCCK